MSLIEIFTEEIDSNRCTVGFTQICINSEKKIQPCCEVPGMIMEDLCQNTFEKFGIQKLQNIYVKQQRTPVKLHKIKLFKFDRKS